MGEQKITSVICAHCGAICPREELHEFDDELYCLDCLEALTEVCDHCGERFLNSELHREQGLTLCRSCLTDEYSYCSNGSAAAPARRWNSGQRGMDGRTTPRLCWTRQKGTANGISV